MYKITVPTVVTNGHFNREKTLAELKRCGAHRIAIAIDREVGYAFSSPENLKLIKDLIEYYRENGLETLVWLGETFGHDGSPAKGKQAYANLKFIDKGDISAFCPMDEKFRTDFCTWVKNIAKCGADMILLDDDFRLGYRGGLGCCCDLHMSELKKEIGEDIPFESLREKIFNGGKNKYRDAWRKVQRDSMYSFAKALRNALNEINPKIRLGTCCSPGVWDCEGTDMFELAGLLAGDTRPFIRPMGAPYWKNHHMLGAVVEYQRTQFEWCKNHDIEIFSEGDTYPRPRVETPASYLECYDMILRAAGGSDGILKYALDYVSDADYETGYVDAMVANKELYEKIEKHFSDKEAVGVRPFNAIHILEEAELNSDDSALMENIQNYPLSESVKFCVVNSLPTTYEKGGVNILFGENARHIPIDDLKLGNIIDIAAAKILMNRGIDVGIEGFYEENPFEQLGFTDVPTEYFIDENEYVRLSPLEISFPKHRDGVKIITEFHTKSNKASGAFEYENKDGIRFLVYPFDALKVKEFSGKGWFDSYSRKRQVIKSIEWLGGSKLPAVTDGNYPRLYILAKKNEKSLCIGLWNLFEDKIPNARITVDTEGEIEFINCNGHKEGNTVVLDTMLYPYEFAAFEIKIC